MTVVRSALPRCASHPARVSLDTCPACGRPRCGTDTLPGVRGPGALPGTVAGRSPDCPTCRRERAAVFVAEERSAGDLERWVRGALGAYAVAVPAGVVASQYVTVGFFAYLVPCLAGALTGLAALRAAGSDGRGVLGGRLRLTALVYALLGTGYAFRFVVGGGLDLYSVDALLAYAVTAVGVGLGTMPPRARAQRSTDR